MFKLLEEAWQITKKYKFLWIFGVFSQYLTGHFSDYFFISNGTSENFSKFISNINVFFIYKLNLYNLANISRDILIKDYNPLFNSSYSLILFILFIAFIILVFLTLISTIAEISLIWAVDRIRRNENINFKLTLKSSFKYFGRIFLFNLFIIFSLLIAIMPALFFILNKKIGGLLIYLGLTVPLYIAFLSYIVVFNILGIRVIIINDTPLIKGILTTAKIIRSNLKQVFKFLIIYLILEFGLAFLLRLILDVSLLFTVGFSSSLSPENQQPILLADIKLFALLIILVALLLTLIAKGVGSTLISSWITLSYLDYFRNEKEKVEKSDSQNVPT